MVLATVAAATVIWFWALKPLGAASYLTSSGASDADIIRQYWPHRLVEPEWVSTTPGRFINWHLMEMRARLAVVAVLWLAVAGGVAYRALVSGHTVALDGDHGAPCAAIEDRMQRMRASEVDMIVFITVTQKNQRGKVTGKIYLRFGRFEGTCLVR